MTSRDFKVTSQRQKRDRHTFPIPQRMPCVPGIARLTAVNNPSRSVAHGGGWSWLAGPGSEVAEGRGGGRLAHPGGAEPRAQLERAGPFSVGARDRQTRLKRGRENSSSVGMVW